FSPAKPSLLSRGPPLPRPRARWRPWPPHPPASTLASAAPACVYRRPLPPQGRALENPREVRRLAPPAAAKYPGGPCAPRGPAAPQSNSRRFADALQIACYALLSARSPATDLSISRTHSSLHHFQQKFSRCVHPRSHCARGNPQHHAHVRSVHLFHERKLQDAAEFCRQALDFFPKPIQHHLLLRFFRTVHHCGRLHALPGRIPLQPAPVASLTVQGQPDNDAVVPGSKFLRFTQRVKLLVSAQARFLCDILSVGRVAQNAVGNLKDAPLILRKALAKSHRGTMRFGSDRKSTRLNSSHGSISYAVFCLKKKNK